MAHDLLSPLCVGLIARGIHWVSFVPTSDDGGQRKAIQQEINDEPVISFHSSSTLPSNVSCRSMRPFSFLDGQTMAWPLHLLTVLRLSDTRVIMRIAHQLDIPEGGKTEFLRRKTLEVLLKKINCPPDDIQEISLTGNQKISDMSRMNFEAGEIIGNVSCPEVFWHQKEIPEARAGSERVARKSFMFRPMQIRTFQITCSI